MPNLWFFRQPALSEDSAGSSEYSSGSTLLSHAPGDKKEQCEAEVSALHQDIESGLQSTEIGDQTTIYAFSGGTPANATCTEGRKDLYFTGRDLRILTCFKFSTVY